VPHLLAGDGSIRFLALPRPRLMALSFEGGSRSEPRFPDFALYLSGEGKVRVREGDGSDREVAEYKAGDELEIGVHSGSMQYVLNGQVLYESAHPVRYPLVVQSCLPDVAGSAVSGPPLPGWPVGAGPPPPPTREEFEAGAWSASPEWSWNREPDPAAPASASPSRSLRRSPVAVSPRVAELLDLAKETTIGPYGQQALTGALGDEDPDVQAAAVWVLAERVDRGDASVTAEIDTDAPAVPIEKHNAKYPPEAFVKKIQGDVVLDVLVSRTGRVVYARVRESIPPLDAAALEAVRSWTFAPARRGGGPFPTVTRVSVPFRILGSERDRNERPIGD
jgi:protein TonB